MVFGAEYVEAALAAQGRKLMVMESSEVKEDLVQDMIEVLTWFCAGLYGRCSARNEAKEQCRPWSNKSFFPPPSTGPSIVDKRAVLLFSLVAAAPGMLPGRWRMTGEALGCFGGNGSVPGKENRQPSVTKRGCR
jgi:hypothetical protein